MEDLDAIVAEALDVFGAAADDAALDQCKARYLGKSGRLTEILKTLGTLRQFDVPRLKGERRPCGYSGHGRQRDAGEK